MTFDELFRKYKEECHSLVCEPPAYMYEKKQGEFTVKDFENLPETRWLELIDGEFVLLNAPTNTHQIITLHIGMNLEQFIMSNDGTCHALICPNVIPDSQDDKTELVPDVVVLCDNNKDKGSHILGGPDLVVEVLSLSTRHRDLGIKKRKYQDGGVREYWTVDLKNKIVVVHDFENDDTINIYSLNDQVPVGILGGKCVVDFKKIMERCTYKFDKEESEDDI